MKTNMQTLTVILLFSFLSLGIMTATAYSQGQRLPVHNLNTAEDFATIQAAIDDSDTLNSHTISAES